MASSEAQAAHLEQKQHLSLVNRLCARDHRSQINAAFSSLRKLHARSGVVRKRKPRARTAYTSGESSRLPGPREPPQRALEEQPSLPPPPCSPLAPPPHLRNLRVRSRSELGRRDREVPAVPYGSNRPQLPTQEHPSPRTGTLAIADADVDAPLEYTTWKTPPNNFLLFDAAIQDAARQVLRPYFAQVVDVPLDFDSWPVQDRSDYFQVHCDHPKLVGRALATV